MRELQTSWTLKGQEQMNLSRDRATWRELRALGRHRCDAARANDLMRLAKDPALQQQLREDPKRLPAFPRRERLRHQSPFRKRLAKSPLSTPRLMERYAYL